MKSPCSVYRALLTKIAILLTVLTYPIASAAQAEAIFSFEDDLQSWETAQGGVTLSQSTFGATEGTMALRIGGLSSGFKNNVATTPNFGPSTPGLSDAFNAFALAGSVIAEGGVPKLEFDLTWDFANYVPAANNFIQLGVFVNSSAASGGGFRDLGTGAFLNGNLEFDSWPTLGQLSIDDGVTLTSTGANSAHIAIPFGPDKELTIADSTSTFYDIGFQSNGGYGGTVDFAVDNFLFTGVPIFEEHTLFSWETPDEGGTPGVNEQLEGWMSAQTPATQNLSISSTGATDGNSALQLDRTPLEDGFTWGSAFALESDTDPDPNVEVTDPVIQAQIDDFVSGINGASQIAVDVTYEDQFPLSPTFTQLWLAFTDETGVYYQAGSASFDINNAAAGTTQTLLFDIADFDDSTPESTKNLAVDGLSIGTNAFGIVLGSSTDAGAIYQLDNLRLISEVVSVDADFDGDVDGNDFLILQRANPELIPDWQAAYGLELAAGSAAEFAAVPEPISAWLCLSGIGWGVACRIRLRRFAPKR